MSTGFRDYNCASSLVVETLEATEVRHVDDDATIKLFENSQSHFIFFGNSSMFVNVSF